MSNIDLPKNIDPNLAEAIEFWNGYGVEVQWYIHIDEPRAVAIGDGFMWSIEVDANGSMSTMEATLSDKETGIVI